MPFQVWLVPITDVSAPESGTAVMDIPKHLPSRSCKLTFISGIFLPMTVGSGTGGFLTMIRSGVEGREIKE